MASFQHACHSAVIITTARIVAPARRRSTNAAIHQDSRPRLDVAPGIQTKWDIWFVFLKRKQRENLLHRNTDNHGNTEKPVKTDSTDPRAGIE